MSQERKIEAQLVAYCKENDVYTRKFTSPGHAGVPDRILVGRFGTVFLELKAPGKRPTPLQMREILAIWKAHGRAYWASSWEGAKAVVDHVSGFSPHTLPINADKKCSSILDRTTGCPSVIS